MGIILNLLLPLAQLLVSGSLGWTGYLALFGSLARLAGFWPAEVDGFWVRLLGGAHVLVSAAMGLSTAFSRTLHQLTPASAFGGIGLQIVLGLLGLVRRQLSGLPFNAVIILACIFIVWAYRKRQLAEAERQKNRHFWQ